MLFAFFFNFNSELAFKTFPKFNFIVAYFFLLICGFLLIKIGHHLNALNILAVQIFLSKQLDNCT